MLTLHKHSSKHSSQEWVTLSVQSSCIFSHDCACFQHWFGLKLEHMSSSNISIVVALGIGPLDPILMSVHLTSLSWPSFHICLLCVLYSKLCLFHITNTTLLKQELWIETKSTLTQKVILHFSGVLKGVSLKRQHLLKVQRVSIRPSSISQSELRITLNKFHQGQNLHK